MTMRHRSKPRATHPSVGRRVLVFERLDARTVLSTTSLLGAAAPWIHGHHAAHDEEHPGRSETFAGRHSGNQSSHGALIDHGPPPGGAFGAGVIPGHHRTGPVVLLAPGAGRPPVFFVNIGGFGPLAAWDPTTFVLLVGLPKTPSPMMDSPGEPARSSVAPSSLVDVPDVGPLVASGPEGEGESAPRLAGMAVASGGSSETIHAEASGATTSVQDAAGALFVVPRETASSAVADYLRSTIAATPAWTPDVTDDIPIIVDPQGGLIKLDPRDDGAAEYGPSNKTDEDAAGTDHVDELADNDAFWDEVIDALIDNEDESADGRPDASKPSPADLAAEPPQPVDVTATFDQGGTIELAAEISTAADAETTTNQTDPLIEPVEVTIDVGIALFQAFELGTELTDLEHAPQVESQSEGDSSGEAIEVPAAEAAQPRDHVAAGVGLLAAWPIAHRASKGGKQRRPAPSGRATGGNRS